MDIQLNPGFLDMQESELNDGLDFARNAPGNAGEIRDRPGLKLIPYQNASEKRLTRQMPPISYVGA